MTREEVLYETAGETTLTNEADFGTIEIVANPSRKAVLIGSWFTLESTPSTHVQISLRLPSGTVASGPGVLVLAKGWLRAHVPNVGTVHTSYNLTSTLEWKGRLPLRRRNERPANANVDASVMTIGGSTVAWTLYALVEYEDD